MTKGTLNLTDSEATALGLLGIAFFVVIVLYYQYTKSVDYEPYACRGCKDHGAWHSREDAFKLGQKHPDADNELEALRHGR
jgi:hypothetical protein